MCTRVWDGQQEIETQGQLADYLGCTLEDLPSDHRYPSAARKASICLRPIDVTKALTAAGKRWHADRGDMMDLIVESNVH